MMKITLALVGLTLSLTANAATVTHNGYTLETDTNIVTGGDLEWLQWTETIGQTASEAMASYEGDGWKIASHQEMVALLNAFNPIGTYSLDENTYSSSIVANSDAKNFTSLFGDTWDASGIIDEYVWNFSMAGALFGSDNDNDGLINFAKITPSYYYPDDGTQDPYMRLYSDNSIYNNRGQLDIGIALVRVSTIPIPAAAYLFGSALIGLAGIKHKK